MQVQETPLRRITNALFKMAGATHAQRTCWFIFKRQGYFCCLKMEVLDPSLLFFSTSQQ